MVKNTTILRSSRSTKRQQDRLVEPDLPL
ncbi:hypothetical protein M6B38_349915 [Iris pallida]|uniref:Ribosomal protein S12 n=1 Tax=Iris pallida TaxID=29817 RepID=A0AAX6E777_IRIPA|nr:hypothetical protein M6B38_203750 [Iris pallida]KAJ6831223.1 hypothetical protein M6B38_349915 [Iris pallida]